MAASSRLIPEPGPQPDGPAVRAGGPAQGGAHERAVARHYDVLDPWYRELWGQDLHHGLWETGDEPLETAVRRLAELAARRAGAGPGVRVLDLGCGYGGTSRLLAAEYGARVKGVTVSPVQFAYAEARARDGNPAYVLGDWLTEAAGVPEGAFDAVVAIESLSHMTDGTRALSEVHRVLRPGGRLVVLDWLAGRLPRGVTRRGLLDPITRDALVPGLRSFDALRGLVGRAGFDVLDAEDLSSRVQRTWTAGLARVAWRTVTDSGTRALLRDSAAPARSFVAAMARIAIGYRTGAFRYGLLTAERRP